jgi:murein L,D-transpeptidase YcbB/YkuD
VPRDLGKVHVVVNLPDYSLRVFDQGKVVWTTRIVIGKPTMQTPLLSETMKYITVNPTWNVPPSIVQNEYLPALAQDPTALERIGLRLTRNPDGQDPARYAEVLLSLTRPNDNYTQERIKRMFGREEQDIQLPTHIPVHLTYQSAFVDDEGKLNFRADVYGLDAKVISAIKNERTMIEVAQERRRDDSDGSTSGSRRRQQQARQQQVVPQRSTLSFFEQVFGGGPSRPPAAVTRYR